MTARSVILGWTAAAALAAVTYFNDLYLKNTFLADSYFPVSAVGLLLFSAILLHPLMRRITPRRAFTPAEWATIFALMLFATYIPSRGLGHHLTNVLMLPAHHERIRPAWQGTEPRLTRAEVLDWEHLKARLQGEDLPLSLRERLTEVLTAPEAEWTVARQEELLRRLNEWLEQEAWEPPDDHAGPEVRNLLQIPPSRRTKRQRVLLTRAALDIELEGAIQPRQAGILELLRPTLLADAHTDSRALDSFISGSASPAGLFDGRLIPWAAWRPALLFWSAVILSMILAFLGLALVVHRQWRDHEFLPFPTMEFARSMLPAADGSWSNIVRDRGFWVATVFIAALHLNNYLSLWWPDYMIRIPLRMDFSPLMNLSQIFERGWGAGTALTPTIYFTIVGLVYFLPSDVSLSVGLAPYLYAFLSGLAITYGLHLGGSRFQPHTETFINSGAFAGLFVMLWFSGRHYYRAVFSRAVGLPSQEWVESSAIWGARAAITGFVLLVFLITRAGVEWPLAAVYTIWLLLVPLVLSRMLAESGVFFLNPRTYGCALLWGFLGAAAVGRQPLLTLSLFSVILILHMNLSFLPFAVSALRIGEEAGLPIGRLALAGLAAVAVALVVMIPVNLWIQYRHGAFVAGTEWSSVAVPTMVFENAAQVRQQLEAQGVRTVSDGLQGFERWRRLFAPRMFSVFAFGLTFALVTLLGFLRRRYPRWPLHPVLFAMFAVWPSHFIGFSFLIGWAVKSAVMKYGGAGVYQRFKPFMIGLVAGETFGALIPMLVGLLHYAITGTRAPTYGVLPT